MTIPLFEKYRPKKFSDIKGQDIAVDKIKAFLTSFEKGISKKNAIILHGPAGTGKTTIAHVLANEMNYEIFELNASDLRNRSKLDEVMKPSIEQHSLFSKSKIILIDEVDGVTSTEYGGLAELIALIEKTKFPIVITCNDVWQNKFNLLRNKCEIFALKEISYPIILEVVKRVANFENKTIPESILKEIAAKSRGDLRAAMNDLQSIINLKDPELMQEQISLREKTQSIFNALKRIFKVRMDRDVIDTYETVDLDRDHIFLWVEENIPSEYRGIELARAFDALSIADVFRGRIHRQQYWHFLTYENFFLTAGISNAKGFKSLPERFTRYNPPTRILKIWRINQKNIQKKSIAGKYAELTHTGVKRAMRDFKVISLIIDNDSTKVMNLSDQEIEYLIEKKQEIAEELKENSIKVNF